MSETVAINPIDFFTPIVSDSRLRDTWWGRLTCLANEYLSPLSIRSQHRGFYARVVDLKSGSCALEDAGRGSWLATAIKVVSYRWWVLPVGALLIKGLDRLAYRFSYKIDEVAHQALQRGDSKLLISVLRQGPADFQLQLRALGLFAREGKLEGVRLLLQRGVDGAVCDQESGLAAIHYAAAANQVESLKLLVEHGSPVNTASEDGKKDSPLHSAIGAKAWNAVAFLKAQKADLGQLNTELNSPQQMLKAAGH